MQRQRSRPPDPGRPDSPGARWEPALAGLLAGLVCAVYAVLAPYGFDLLVIEEAFYAECARRIQLGALPYRDFAIPYTPGVFYFYAWVMDWVGPHLLPLRFLQAACHGLLCLALYAAGRVLMPPFFAALPALLLLGMDVMPPYWDIHPGWFATLASVLMVLAVARYVQHGRSRWLFAAGVATGMGFAAKQNIALLGLMALLWLLAVAESRLALVPPPRRLWWRRPGSPTPPLGTEERTGRRHSAAVRCFFKAVALVLLPAAAALLIRPFFSTLLAAVFVVPLAAVSAAATPWLRAGTPSEQPPPHAGSSLGREASFYARPLLVLGGFAVVTLPWLVPLIGALDGRVELLGVFVGDIDQTGYFWAMSPPVVEHVLAAGLLLLVPWIVVVLAASRVWGRWGAAVGLGALGALAVAGLNAFAWGTIPRNPLLATYQAQAAARALWNEWAADTAWAPLLYLPALALWPALAHLVLRPPGAPGRLLRLWYLAAGSALFLSQYPRMDEMHLPWAAPILLTAGADFLHVWYLRLRRLVPPWHDFAVTRAALRLSLVLLPAVAVLPMTRVRSEYLIALRRGGLAPLDLPNARVWLPTDAARTVRELVAFIREETSPGEPIFAYPAEPGVYFLADRPNPTRFNHLFVGMATPADQQEIVRQLATVRYVIWNYPHSFDLVQPGVNAPVTEYVRTQFRLQRFIGPYAILSRDPSGSELHYPLPSTTS